MASTLDGRNGAFVRKDSFLSGKKLCCSCGRVCSFEKLKVL